MKHIKDGVKSSDIELVVLDGVIKTALVFQDLGYVPVITSKEDGTHMPGSLHYKKRAFDWRTRDVPPAERPPLRDVLQRSLGPDWDVVLEKDHLHTEYDPKTKVMNA